MKLQESLNKQMASRPGDISTATMFSLTPPQASHRSHQSAVANTSQDSSERGSRNSKDSSELATDNLLDLSVPARPHKQDVGSSDSDPLTSSSSDNEVPATWEKFGDEPPPVPPPRSKLKAPKLIAKQRASALVQGSTVGDFGASIAETLLARGKKDIPDSPGRLFSTDLEFFRTLGLEKPESDLPHPMVPTTVSRILTVVPSSSVPNSVHVSTTANPLVPTSVPLVPTPVPLVPTSVPLVPTPVPLVPTSVPLVPTPVPLVPTPVPLVPSTPLVPTPVSLVPAPFPVVPLVPCPSVPLSTAGVLTSSNSQNTVPLQFRSQSMSSVSNGYPPGQRASPIPSNHSSPLREGTAQRLSSLGATKSVDVVESSAALPSRPPRSTNPFSASEGVADARPRLADPFSDLVKQTMAKTKEGKQLS